MNVNVRPGEIRQIGRVRRRARARRRERLSSPSARMTCKNFFIANYPGRARCGGYPRRREERTFPNGAEPFRRWSRRWDRRPRGDSLSLCRHSRMPRHLTARVDSMRQATTRMRARRRDGKACARNTVAQTRRVHAISTLLLSAGSTGSSPHHAPCGVSVGYPRVRSTSSTPDWVLFSAFDFSARVRLFESTSRTRVCTRAIAAQPRPRLALAVFSSLC